MGRSRDTVRAWRYWEKNSGRLAIRPRFEPDAFRMQVKSVTVVSFRSMYVDSNRGFQYTVITPCSSAFKSVMLKRFDRSAVLVRGSEYWARTDRHRGRTDKRSLIALSIGRLLSADLEMMPARHEINGHAQDFVVYDELLLLIGKAFAHCTLTRHATRNA